MFEIFGEFDTFLELNQEAEGLKDKEKITECVGRLVLPPGKENSYESQK